MPPTANLIMAARFAWEMGRKRRAFFHTCNKQA
jgi:hypothetical protein